MNNDYTILKKENKYLEKKFKIKYDNEKKEYRLKNSDFSFFNGDFNKAKELGGVFINEISKIALKNSDFLFFREVSSEERAENAGAIYIEEIKKFVIKKTNCLFFRYVNSEEKNKVTKLGAFYIAEDIKRYVIKYSILNKYNILNWYKNLAEDINVNTNNASIFIGRRIETDLLRSLSKAKKRIYIISPYISDKNVDLCSEILKDSTKNIDFKMITSLDIENPKNYIKLALKKLITVELDKSKEEEIQKIKNEIDSKYKSVEKTNEIVTEKTNETPYQDDLNFFFTFIISILILLLFFNSKLLIIFSILFSLFYFFNRKNRKNKNDKNKNDKNNKNKNDKNNNNVFYNRDKIESEIKNLQEKLKNYFITSRKISNLNFKVINDDFKNNDDFLHIKMYIIDDTVYLGSLNFTITAFSRNIESLIKIENPDITEKLKNYFENLYENKDNKEYEFLDDISIAKTIYSYDDFFKNNQQNT